MIIDKLINNAKKDKKRIILVETDDIRTLKAAEDVKNLDFANIILVGDSNKINDLCNKNNINLDNIEIINPINYKDTDFLINELYNLRKEKGMTLLEAENLIKNDYLYFGDMLVLTGYADGLVAGATHSSSDVLRAALKTVKTDKQCNIVSSFFLMELDNKNLGSDGVFIFSDCGLIENPTEENLVDIAYQASESFKKLVGDIPKVAFLSYSTNLSSESDEVYKVRNAVKLFKEKYPDIIADGEMQLDAAIIKEVQEKKFKESKIKGDANILIFPNLSAGNIGYKLTERFGNAKAYGPITQGIKKPINDLSRGCTYKDIVGTIAITCNQVK